MNCTMAPLFSSAPAPVLQSISLGGGGTFDSKLTESVPSPLAVIASLGGNDSEWKGKGQTC